jgi:hypothetical protein
VREWTAYGLVNALVYAKAAADGDRLRWLLASLRGLADAYPDDAAVREQLRKSALIRP